MKMREAEASATNEEKWCSNAGPPFENALGDSPDRFEFVTFTM